eukprot:TRINITY_DN800_c0_g2_i1.p1 TRINITY_DN800_c0_g2~~TRINITY_DN800_c0_g2_i1.p1  ORF type:complete len:818 (+),score=187.01 TRINITY_DN800_c0_g2_i1:470-2923(+)
MAILQEELDTKIKETEQLHIRMFEERRDHKQLVDTLADKLEKIKVQLSKKADEYEDLSSEHKHTVSKLTAEKSELISRVEDLSETLQRTKALMQQREHSMTQLQQKLTSELESVQSLVAQKIPFDDSKVAKLNAFNVPTFDRPVQQKRDVLVANLTGPTCRKIAEIYREMLDAEREKALLQNANRTLELPEPIRHCNRKLIAALAESAQIASTTVDALQNNNSVAGGVLEAALQKFGSASTKLKSYRLLKLQLETQHQQKLADNKTIQETLQQNEDRLHLTISKLVSYFGLYWRMINSAHNVAASSDSAPSKSNAVTVLRKILGLITRLREVLRDRSSVLSSRVAFESQLDPFLPPEIKLLNEKILVSLSSLLALLDKTSAVMDQWLGLISAPPRYPVRGVRGATASSMLPTSQESRTRAYMKLLEQAPEFASRSISYADQLVQADRLAQIKAELADRDGRIRDLSTQISGLESDKAKLVHELSTMKDQLASKQGSLTELLGELADTRQKLSQTSTLHQRQVTRVRELERERDSLLLRAAQSNDSSSEHHAAPPSTPAAGPTLLSFDEPAANVAPVQSSSSSDDLLSWDASTSTTPDTATVSNVPAVDLLGGGDDLLLSGSQLDDRKDFTTTPSIESVPEPATSSIGDQKWRMVVMDEAGKQTSSLGFSLEDKEREQQVKRFYEEKYVNMRAIVEATDRKALDLMERTKSLETRLADAVRERDSLQSKMSEISTTLGRSKEELDTTRENYESQLKLMTEHLVSLNEKIGGYEEQLSTLHNCKVRCGKCSTWNTIHWLITEGKMGQRCSKGNESCSKC